MSKIMIFVVSLCFLVIGSALPLRVGQGQSQSQGEAKKAPPAKAPQTQSSSFPPQGDPVTVVGSGQATATDGVSAPHQTTGPVSAKVPELRPEDIRAREEELTRENLRVPVAPGKAWKSIPKPEVPATQGVFKDPLSEKRSSGLSQEAATDFRYQVVHNLSPSEAPTRSVIGEPSVANMGNTLFFTGNWYAAQSTDGGQSFTYASPFSTFPSVNNSFCCDQVANYARQQDMMLWEVLYGFDGTSNTVRIARAVGTTAVASNTWTYYDFTPQDFGFGTQTWLDFPNLTVASTFLYATSNVFDKDNHFTGAVIWRIPLSELAGGGTIHYSYYAQSRSATDVSSLRCTEAAGTTMYCAGFFTTSQLRIFHWDDGAGGILWDNVDLAPFSFLHRGEGIAYCPSGANWVDHADGRVLGAWVANGVLGFMWGAKQDDTFPYPYTVVGQFNQSSRSRISQTPIWNQNYAWLYPTASVNASGNLAGLLTLGGASSNPTANVWVSDDIQNGFNPLALFGGAQGNAGPDDDVWGDYQTVRPHKDFPNTWVAGSYFLENGGAGNNVIPRYLWFGRVRDLGSPPSGTPNLTPYQPSGWSDKIVTSYNNKTNSDTTIYASDTLYVDWAVVNNGTTWTQANFDVQLYFDGIQRASWFGSSPLLPDWWVYVEDYSPGSLTPGTHTIKIVGDSGNAIPESNESDNTYTKTITVLPGQPNLTPHKPAGWSDKIVLSNSQGTNTDSSAFNTSDTLYVDWAVIDSGNAPTGSTFYTRLLVDGVERNSWYVDPRLNANSYVYVQDYSLGSLSAGTHTIRIVADSTGTIPESNESDNEYARTITVVAGPGTPSNDNFSNAQTISGNSGSATGNNSLATKEPAEPEHAANSGGRSLWYRWQAPANGNATFTTLGSTFDTLLAVYTGSGLGGLTFIASNDDDPLGGQTSRVTFNAISGTTYNIAVDGFFGAQGNLSLNWNLQLGSQQKPLIFIPGLMGSSLDSDDLLRPNLWPGPFCGQITDHNILTLDPEKTQVNIIPNQAINSVCTGKFYVPIYGSLLNFLTSSGGYHEYLVDSFHPEKRTTAGCDLSQRNQNPSLFIFAYDWRLSNGDNATRLKDYVGCVQQFYPNSKVDILTHSMGGLLARRYILNNPSDHSVDKLITIAAPWLGAPKAINVMKTGEYDDLNKIILKKTLKSLSEFFPSAHQLLPTGSYFALGGVPYVKDGVTYSSYDQFVTAFNNEFPESLPANTGKAFHGRSGQDDWRGDQTGVQYYHIYGQRMSADTIRTVFSSQVTIHGLFGWKTQRVFRTEPTVGDKTVPVLSAERKNVSSGLDLNASSAILKLFSNTDKARDDLFEHTGLTQNPDVQNYLLSILNGTLQSQSRTESFLAVAPAYYVREIGAATITVTDDNGNSTNPLSDPSDAGLPNVTTSIMGDKAALIILPTDQTFTIKLRTDRDPIFLEIQKGTDTDTSLAIRYQDLGLPEGVEAMLKISAQGVEPLKYDANADGFFESVLPSQASVSGTAAQDTQPPTVTISAVPQGNNVLLTINSTDNASGIKATYYSLDGTDFQSYTAPFTVNPYQGPVVYAFADDNVANRSGLVTYYPSITQNQLDNAQFFVRQHYLDFLNREPDSAGFGFWIDQIAGCGTNQTCINAKRVDVSNAFFYELEFQQTAAYVYRVYREAFGNSQPFPNPFPDSNFPGEDLKIPSYGKFSQDRALVVGSSNLAQSQLDFANAFVQRPEFIARYPASLSTAAQFVDAVLATISSIGVDLSSQRQNLINLYGTFGRGGVIYRLADDNTKTNPINNRALIDAEYNRAFVYGEYGGYLRRDSDIAGFRFWLNQVNSGPLRDVTKQHAMVCAFVNSDEYQLRFSTIITHNSFGDCPH